MPYSLKKKSKLLSIERASEAKRQKYEESVRAAAPPTPGPSSYPHVTPAGHLLNPDQTPVVHPYDAVEVHPNPGEAVELDTDLPGLQFYYHPPSRAEAIAALETLNSAVRTHRRSGPGYIYAELNQVTLRRCFAMTACLNFYLGDDGSEPITFTSASCRAAKAHGHGPTYAKSIRKWIRHTIKSGDLPENCWGWWNVSSLEDEDVATEIKLHLQQIGKYARAQDIVDFLLDPGVRERLGLKKKISLRTAQRWLSRSGFRWRAEPKGQYFDGHERADVVTHRQTIFVPFWKALERRMVIYGENGLPIPKHQMNLLEGEKPVIFWFHDESIFYANDRRHVRWVYVGEHAIPFKKGEGSSIMVADFMCAEFGWLRGASEKELARVVLSPGKNRDGYFTSERVIEQLRDAVKIAQKQYPDHTHVFLYDNAPSHTKRPISSISARRMPKNPSQNFTFATTDAQGRKVQVRMEDGRLPDGTRQPFYFPDNHPQYPGWFKGMAQILRERGLGHIADKRAECPNFKCGEGETDCCCRRALFCQPDFESCDSSLEEVARELGSLVVFLPKYHCELNPIEQCWGYAKRLYREKPPCSREATMRTYVLEAIEAVPLDSMRKFTARSQRFVDAYFTGLGGSEAIKWATKEHRRHRETPSHIPYEQIAPTYVYGS